MKRKNKEAKRSFMSGLFGFAAFDTYHTARVHYLAQNASVGTQR